jgi:hypothetical protein
MIEWYGESRSCGIASFNAWTITLDTLSCQLNQKLCRVIVKSISWALIYKMQIYQVKNLTGQRFLNNIHVVPSRSSKFQMLETFASPPGAMEYIVKMGPVLKPV